MSCFSKQAENKNLFSFFCKQAENKNLFSFFSLLFSTLMRIHHEVLAASMGFLDLGIQSLHMFLFPDIWGIDEMIIKARIVHSCLTIYLVFSAVFKMFFMTENNPLLMPDLWGIPISLMIILHDLSMCLHSWKMLFMCEGIIPYDSEEEWLICKEMESLWLPYVHAIAFSIILSNSITMLFLFIYFLESTYAMPIVESLFYYCNRAKRIAPKKKE